MKKKFVKVMAAMTAAVLIVGNTTVVAEAHHSRSSRAAVQLAIKMVIARKTEAAM